MSEYATVLHLHKSFASPGPVGPVYEFPGSKCGIENTTDDDRSVRGEESAGDSFGAPPSLQTPCRYAATAQGFWPRELNDWERDRRHRGR